MPVLGIDARSRADAKGTLIALVLHALRGSTHASATAGWRPCCPSSSSTGTAPSAAWAPWRGSSPRTCPAACGWSWSTTAPSPTRSPIVRKGLPGRRRRCSSCRATAGSGPAPTSGFRHVLANPEPGDVGWIGLAPHDAEPAPGCLARMLEVVGERPARRPGLRRLRRRRHPDRRPLLRRHPRARHGDRRVGAGRPPARHAAARPPRSCSRRSACSTSATSRTARRPTSPSGPRPPAGRPGSSAAPSS